jgi:hypothetical protein
VAASGRTIGVVIAIVGLSSLVLRAGQGAPATPATAPLANVNQLMRAILFPNANIIFNVQVEDPGAPVAPVSGQKGGAGFSITAWGNGLYQPWEIVSYAATALEDSAALLNRADRLCQNGKPAPISRADWTKFTDELAASARVIYAASQAKDRDKVSELTERLNDSCQACHQAYRRGDGPDRCTPRP